MPRYHLGISAHRIKYFQNEATWVQQHYGWTYARNAYRNCFCTAVEFGSSRAVAEYAIKLAAIGQHALIDCIRTQSR